jgi:hypothetical protein
MFQRWEILSRVASTFARRLPTMRPTNKITRQTESFMCDGARPSHQKSPLFLDRHRCLELYRPGFSVSAQPTGLSSRGRFGNDPLSSTSVPPSTRGKSRAIPSPRHTRPYGLTVAESRRRARLSFRVSIPLADGDCVISLNFPVRGGRVIPSRKILTGGGAGSRDPTLTAGVSSRPAANFHS